MTVRESYMHPQRGPNTHDDPHKTGAARKAVQPLFVQKNPFKNYLKKNLLIFY